MSDSPVPLNEYLKELINNLEERFDECWQAHRREHDLLSVFLDKTEKTLEHRLEGMNQFREELRAQNASFMRRELIEAAMSVLDKKADANKAYLDNLQGRIWALGALMGFIVAAGSIALGLIAALGA